MDDNYLADSSVRPIIDTQVKRTSETIIAVCIVFIILLFLAIAIVISLVEIPQGRILYPSSSNPVLTFPGILETPNLLTTDPSIPVYALPGMPCLNSNDCVPGICQ